MASPATARRFRRNWAQAPSRPVSTTDRAAPSSVPAAETAIR